MSDSTFNAEQFLNTSTTEAGETTYFPVPVGEWPATIEKVMVREITTMANEKRHVAEVTWNVQDDGVRRLLESDRAFVRQSIWLDLGPGGGLLFGRNKNVRLSRLREAVGQNRGGREWNFNHLTGQMATIKVIHRADQNGDPMAEVSAVAAL